MAIAATAPTLFPDTPLEEALRPALPGPRTVASGLAKSDHPGNAPRPAGNTGRVRSHAIFTSRYRDGSATSRKALVPDADRHSNAWMDSPKSGIQSLRAYWQRELEIRKAVEALSKFDDQTLRDMGISSQLGLEYTVRYCRDC